MRLLLVTGSLRAGSTNSAVLRTARTVAPEGVTTVVHAGPDGLPHFNPDDDVVPLHPAVRDLRDQIHSAHGVVFSTPEYAGALPGSFKNLLDWTIGDDQPRSIYDKPVAWINVSTRGATEAHRSLRTVQGYAHADVVEAACAEIPVTSSMVSADGLIADTGVRDRLTAALAALVAHISYA